MSQEADILIVGGYGEVGHRLARLLEITHPDRVIVAGRHPERVPRLRARRVDVDDLASIDAALEGVGLVIACVRQREPQLLRAAVRRGLAYTSIAPPALPWPEIQDLSAEARLSGARVIFGAGIEPGISSVLARAAADRVGRVERVETALLFSVGDSYGSDSMVFLMDELAQGNAFTSSTLVEFPPPVGVRRAYNLPFSDQRYYAHTLGARTAIARLALDPPWIARAVSMLVHLGARKVASRGGAHGPLSGMVERLRMRHAGEDRFALLVEVQGEHGVVRADLLGRGQAQATAAGVLAIAEALLNREVTPAGVHMAEQVIAPDRFFKRLAAQGLYPNFTFPSAPALPASVSAQEREVPRTP
jgi:saccharopine dehydrogenase (NAD+, L-lysine forming)